MPRCLHVSAPHHGSDVGPVWSPLGLPRRRYWPRPKARWRRREGAEEAVSYTHLTLPTICSV
eukprot:12586818-Alexandrium_andersonii.AAC.1